MDTFWFEVLRAAATVIPTIVGVVGYVRKEQRRRDIETAEMQFAIRRLSEEMRRIETDAVARVSEVNTAVKEIRDALASIARAVARIEGRLNGHLGKDGER
jgi:molybdopterin synthase catalytic subunit